MIINIRSEVVKEPLSIDDVKKFLKISSNSDDNLLGILIVSARKYAERYLDLSLVGKIIELAFNDELSADVLLPYKPIISIDSFSGRDSSGERIAISKDVYFFERGGNTMRIYRTILYRSIYLRYTTGFISSIPKDIYVALLNHVGALYSNKGEKFINSQYNKLKNVCL